MKKLTKSIATLISGMILIVAAMAVSVPCIVYYYQPKTPQDAKARIAALKCEK